jgi:GNAT superfamily N-acetyltransferase
MDSRSAPDTHPLRWLAPGDGDQVAAVYRDAVLSQTQGLYSEAQIRAWAQVAQEPAFRAVLERGLGWASCAQADPATIEAFAVLDPGHRLSLLYCRGRASRQGRANALLDRLEHHARDCGCGQLHTEASQLSRPLLQRRGWVTAAAEVVVFAGMPFERWRMIKALNSSRNPHG